jgi:hypothetical protein
LVYFLFEYFLPKICQGEGKDNNIEEHFNKNLQAITGFTKNMNDDTKKFVDSLGHTITKKIRDSVLKSQNVDNKLLKKRRKRSTTKKQIEKSKFYQPVNENLNDNDSFMSGANRKSSMFDETNSLSACVLSSPPMSPTRFNDNIFPDIFVNNTSLLDHINDFANFRHDDYNALRPNNIYQV